MLLVSSLSLLCIKMVLIPLSILFLSLCALSLCPLALGSSPGSERSELPSVQACLNRVTARTTDKSRGGVNGRVPGGRPRLQSKPPGT